jgi:hypothetical protein
MRDTTKTTDLKVEQEATCLPEEERNQLKVASTITTWMNLAMITVLMIIFQSLLNLRVERVRI